MQFWNHRCRCAAALAVGGTVFLYWHWDHLDSFRCQSSLVCHQCVKDLQRGERVLQISFGSGFKCNSAVPLLHQTQVKARKRWWNLGDDVFVGKAGPAAANCYSTLLNSSWFPTCNVLCQQGHLRSPAPGLGRLEGRSLQNRTTFGSLQPWGRASWIPSSGFIKAAFGFNSLKIRLAVNVRDIQYVDVCGDVVTICAFMYDIGQAPWKPWEKIYDAHTHT